MSGVDMAHAAFQVLQPGSAPSDQRYGWTLDQAVERLSAEAWQKYKVGDWRECAAYAVIQWISAERRLDQGYDGHVLALAQIRTILENLEARRREPVPEPVVAADLFGDSA